MTNRPEIVESDNLSHAWANAFLHVFRGPHGLLKAPLLVSVTGFEQNAPIEDETLRSVVDDSLLRIDQSRQGERRRKGRKSRNSRIILSVRACAETIFPTTLWSPERRRTANEVFDRYLNQYLPRLRRLDSRNRRGTYFQRMIAYTGVKVANGNLVPHTINQLAEILRWWERDTSAGRSTRHSALQVACFDPPKDSTGAALQAFPCLQQVSFDYDRSDNTLTVNGYYPAQFVFDRGYGNYLGLCRLGAFMACSMGLTLSRMNCFVAYPELGSVTKTEVQILADAAESALRTKRPTHLAVVS